MSGLRDLKGDLFMTPEEVAELFHRPVAWVYRNRFGFLKPAARKFGKKTLLFAKAELQRIIEEAAADQTPPT